MATASVISTQPTPDEALQRLVDGNEAFVADAPVPADCTLNPVIWSPIENSPAPVIGVHW